MNDLYIMHYGVGHDKGGHSGRYPWGSGEDPYQDLSASAKRKLVKESKKEFATTNPRAARISNKLTKYGGIAAAAGGAATLLGIGAQFIGAYYNIPVASLLGYDAQISGTMALINGSGASIAGNAIKNTKSKNNARKKFNDSVLKD